MKKSYAALSKLHLYFLKSTVEITLVCQLGLFLLLFFSEKSDPNAARLMEQPLYFVPIGLFLDLIYKEMTHEEGYYFYYNQGIRKMELWLSATCAWTVLLVFINLIIRLCVNA